MPMLLFGSSVEAEDGVVQVDVIHIAAVMTRRYRNNIDWNAVHTHTHTHTHTRAHTHTPNVHSHNAASNVMQATSNTSLLSRHLRT